MYFPLSKPKQVTFLVALIVAILAVAFYITKSNFADIELFWVMGAAFVILALGNLVRGL